MAVVDGKWLRISMHRSQSRAMVRRFKAISRSNSPRVWSKEFFMSSACLMEATIAETPSWMFFTSLTKPTWAWSRQFSTSNRWFRLSNRLWATFMGAFKFFRPIVRRSISFSVSERRRRHWNLILLSGWAWTGNGTHINQFGFQFDSDGIHVSDSLVESLFNKVRFCSQVSRGIQEDRVDCFSQSDLKAIEIEVADGRNGRRAHRSLSAWFSFVQVGLRKVFPTLLGGLPERFLCLQLEWTALESMC